MTSEDRRKQIENAEREIALSNPATSADEAIRRGGREISAEGARAHLRTVGSFNPREKAVDAIREVAAV